MPPIIPVFIGVYGLLACIALREMSGTSPINTEYTIDLPLFCTVCVCKNVF